MAASQQDMFEATAQAGGPQPYRGSSGLKAKLRDDPFAAGYTELVDAYERAPAATPQNIPATFSETFTPAHDLILNEEQSISESRWWQRQIAHRNREVAEVLGLDSVPRSLEYSYAVTGRGAMKRVSDKVANGELVPLDDGSYETNTPEAEAMAQSYPDAVEAAVLMARARAIDPSRVQTDAEIQEGIAGMARVVRESAQADLARPKSAGGAVGQFAGAMTGFLTDPLIAASMFVGGGSIRGPSILRNAAKAFGVEATIAGAVEIPVQASVWGFKDRIDSPWGAKDAALNVLMASVGAGGARAAGSAAVDSIGGALARWSEVPEHLRTDEGRWAASLLDEIEVFNTKAPFVPSPDALNRHWEAIRLAGEQIENGIPVNVVPLTRDLDLDPSTPRVDAEDFMDDAVPGLEQVAGRTESPDATPLVEPPRLDDDPIMTVRREEDILDEAETRALLADVNRILETEDVQLPERILYGESGEIVGVESRTAREQFDELATQRDGLENVILCVRGGG